MGREKVVLKSQEEITTRCRVVPSGFAGIGPNGSFFEAPDWVDVKKTPGHTSQEPAVSPPGWWIHHLYGKTLLFSPNLVWYAISLFVYFYFPYNFEAAKDLKNFGWVYERLVINTVLVFGYVGFWHCVLYVLGWSERPFHPNRKYRFGKVLHNMWYNFLGTVQYTVWEAIMMYCYATKRLPYITDRDSFSTTKGMIMFFIVSVGVPLYRETHFYFAHRFIHIKALYKYVHALHHRNTDIEPFAGLSMHPVEHLYYYSSIGPSLVLLASPFGFLWNGIHLIISPAASHSGWEDHFQSDQYHYLHHRFFECNYGTSNLPLDRMFGTFRDKLKESGTTYKGAAEEKVDQKAVEIHDKKATLNGLPEPGFVVYLALNCFIWLLLWYAVQHQYGIEKWNPHCLAFLTSTGPIIIAQLMTNLTERGNRSIFYPFHKDGWKAMSMHLFVSSLVCIAPVYIMVHMLLSEPGNSFLYWLLG
eukprot:TCONS_00044236-protein